MKNEEGFLFCARHPVAQVMAQLAVAHAAGRLARNLVQPAMNLFKRLARPGGRFRAVFCERRHKPFRIQSIPITCAPPGCRVGGLAGPASAIRRDIFVVRGSK